MNHTSIRKAITASCGKYWEHLIEQQQALATEKMEFSYSFLFRCILDDIVHLLIMES